MRCRLVDDSSFEAPSSFCASFGRAYGSSIAFLWRGGDRAVEEELRPRLSEVFSSCSRSREVVGPSLPSRRDSFCGIHRPFLEASSAAALEIALSMTVSLSGLPPGKGRKAAIAFIPFRHEDLEVLALSIGLLLLESLFLLELDGAFSLVATSRLCGYGLLFGGTPLCLL